MTAAYDRDERFGQVPDHGAGEPQEAAAPPPGASADSGAEAAGKPAAEPPVGDADDESGSRGGEDLRDRGESKSGLEFELAAAQQALAERTADLQRLQAEYVNYKRRVDRDRELVRHNAVSNTLVALLPVLDDIDRADEAGDVSGGFKVVADSLNRTLGGMGLVKFGKPGDEFDPNIHEALMHSHSPDVTTTTCQSIISAGYRIGERVVRPARVTVVDPEPNTDDDGAISETGDNEEQDG